MEKKSAEWNVTLVGADPAIRIKKVTGEPNTHLVINDGMLIFNKPSAKQDPASPDGNEDTTAIFAPGQWQSAVRQPE